MHYGITAKQTAATNSVAPFVKARWPLLRSLNLNNRGPQCYSFPAQGIVELRQASWPLLGQLTVYSIKDLDEDVVRSLVLGDWPKMQFLQLSTSHTCATHDGDVRDLEERLCRLVHARWPNLKMAVNEKPVCATFCKMGYYPIYPKFILFLRNHFQTFLSTFLGTCGTFQCVYSSQDSFH